MCSLHILQRLYNGWLGAAGSNHGVLLGLGKWALVYTACGSGSSGGRD
jgi:hypothetical protein